MVELESWERGQFEPGGGDAFLFYVVHGQVNPSAGLSRSRYRCSGILEGLEAMA